LIITKASKRERTSYIVSEIREERINATNSSEWRNVQ
jgi:hypothetical protein